MGKVILTVGDLKEFLSQFLETKPIKEVFTEVQIPEELGVSEVLKIETDVNSIKLKITGSYIY